MNNTSLREEGGEESICPGEPQPVTTIRLMVILGLASPLAFWGFINNGLLLRYFGKKENRSSPTLYLAVLALLDTLICITYITLFGVDAVAIYNQIGWLYDLYNYYCVPLFYCSKVIQLSATYVILTATTERLIQNTSLIEIQQLRCITWSRTRYFIVLGIILCSIAIHTPTLFEMKVYTYPNCNGTEYWSNTMISRIPQFAESAFITAYNAGIIPAIQIFLPFFGLLILNLAIIRALKYQMVQRENERKTKASNQFTLHKKTSNTSKAPEEYGSPDIYHNGKPKDRTEEIEIQEETALLGDQKKMREKRPSQGKMAAPMAAPMLAAKFYQRRFMDQRDRQTEQKKLQGATITLVVIATSYLICNSLGLFVGILERLPSQPLLFGSKMEPSPFYTASTDLLSILHMINSFIRIFIYVACNPELRKALKSHYINIA